MDVSSDQNHKVHTTVLHILCTTFHVKLHNNKELQLKAKVCLQD